MYRVATLARTPAVEACLRGAASHMPPRKRKEPTEDDEDNATQSSQSSQSLAAAASPLSPEETEKLANELCRYGVHTL